MTTKIVAVDGPGAAGKTTFAARLARELGGVQVVSTDDFASWDEPLELWPRLLEGALEPLSRNEIGRYRRTDWDRTGVEAWGEVRPAEFVILEGVSASRQAFRPYLAYSIWVETARDLRLRRGLERDGGNARAQWERWMAEEDDYVELERPQERADLVVRGDQEL
jgi:uridine kinase